MKTLLNFLLIITTISLNGQVLLDETFQSGRFPPNKWKSYDQDGRVVNSAVSNFLSGSWEKEATSSTNNSAVSTAYYTPAGASDDWLITPSIIIPKSNAVTKTILSYFTICYTTQALPGLSTYELRVSTTGTAVADFTNVLNVSQHTSSGNWLYETVDLDQFAGDTIYIAWRNISNNTYVIALDDVIIETLTNDAIALDQLYLPEIASDGDTIEISGQIFNRGGNTLESFEISWTEDGTTYYKDSVTGLNLGPYIRADFTHKTKLVASNPGNYMNIDVAVSKPNGQIDSTLNDDTLSANVFINKGITVAKNVLLEQYTTTICPFCPDGKVVVEEAEDSLENLIAISVHSCFGTDDMTNTEATAICNRLGINSAPTAMIDRFLFDGETDVAFGRGPLSGTSESGWISRSRDRSEMGSAVNINISGTYDTNSRKVDVEVISSFVDYVIDGNKRLSLIIVEDSVNYKTSSNTYVVGKDQLNAYYNSTGHPYNGVGRPRSSNPNTSFISDYYHRNVMRDILPSTWGDGVFFPDTIALNQDYKKKFSFTLDSQWDETKVYLIPVVSFYGGGDNSGYEVINANRIKLTNSQAILVGIDEDRKEASELTVFPNPAQDNLTLEFNLSQSDQVELQLFDLTAKLLREENLGMLAAGKQRYKIDISDLSNGFYFISLNTNGKTITKKVTVNK